MWLWMAAALVIQFANEPFTSPASPSPEYGHGLNAETSREGWIALFDGQTTYGWSDAKVAGNTLSGGRTTTVFGPCELRGNATTGGKVTIGDQVVDVPAGLFEHSIQVNQPGPISLGTGLELKSLVLKPTLLKPLFNGRDLTGLKILPHPKLPEARQTKWSIEDGKLLGIGGPGAVELEGMHGDLVIQVEVRMRAKLVNGGLFFRAVPGQFMNGYEAQLFNGCYKEDAAKPARYSTGAIDDRLLARRLVSRDLEPFTMTVIAVGPHIATWVNGYQTVDWTDTRASHENPREGLRLEPGTIQLQAHDPATDIEFRRVLIGHIGQPKK